MSTPTLADPTLTDPARSSTIPASSQSVVDQLTYLQTAHPWLEPQAAVTLASSNHSNTDLATIADSLKQQVAQTWNGISHFFDDPVLAKTDSPLVALHRYLTGSFGPLPVTDAHVSSVQQGLQAKGFGQGLNTDGVWGPAWQAALQQKAQADYQSQAAGNRVGAKSSEGLLHSFLSSLTPSGIASAIVGTIKSLPADVSTLLGDAWGGISGIPDQVSHPFGYSDTERAARDKAMKQQAEQVQNTLGGNAYRQAVGLPQVTAQTYNPITSGLNDLGTLFLLSGVAGAAKGITTAGRSALTDGLTTRLATQEAMRGPGVLARSLLKPVGTRIATSAAIGGTVGGVQAAVRGQSVETGIGQGAAAGLAIGALGGLLPGHAYDNLPMLRSASPVLGKLIATGSKEAGFTNGAYYIARQALATPYQFGAVRLAGTAFSQAQAYSLKAHAVAYLESQFGDQAGTIQAAIENTAPLSAINGMLQQRLGFTVDGTHFGPDLDWLMYALHGPMTTGAPGTITHALKGDAQAATDAYSAGLTNLGVKAQFEQGTGLSWPQLIDQFGSEAALNKWVDIKTQQIAADQYAQEAYNTLRASTSGTDVSVPEPFSPEWDSFMRAHASAAFNDPQALKDSMARLVGTTERTNFIQNEIKKEIAYSQVSPQAYLKGSGQDYIHAGELLTEHLLPLKDTHLLTPQTAQVMPAGMDPQLYQPDLQAETVHYLGTGQTAAGNVGVGKLTTKVSQEATVDAQTFAAELRDAKTPLAQNTWVRNISQYLFDHFGYDSVKLQVYDRDPEKLLNLLVESAKGLAAEVHLSTDAPPSAREAVAGMKALGYRPVVGTDIGHAFRSDLPSVSHLGEQISWQRKIAQNLGVSNQTWSRGDFAVEQKSNIMRELQQVEDAKHFLPPRWTVTTLLNQMQNSDLLGKQLGLAQSTLVSLSRRAHQATYQELVRTGAAPDLEHAEAELKNQLALQGGISGLSRKDFHTVLGRTEGKPLDNTQLDLNGDLAIEQLPLMTSNQIDQVYKAVQAGMGRTPVSMLGLGKLENMIRYMPFRLGPDHGAALALMTLPNRLAQLRDTWRFNLSPFFDLRRIAKVNVKMGVNGVEPTLAPVKNLVESGTWDSAHQTLDRIQGLTDPRHQWLDENDRYLEGQSVFGLFNQRHFQAYAAQKLSEAGQTDEQIKATLDKIFQYTTGDVEGRTQLERSLNTIWFPFSFEKSVAKNVGGYLLDHPAQAMILSNSLAAYHDFSNNHQDNPLAMTWLTKHAPLLDEAMRLNTFAHGISPGEFGGINRPLLNVFLPQSWDSTKHSNSTLLRFVPAVADLHRIINEGTDQSRIIAQAFSNAQQLLLNGRAPGVLNQLPAAQAAASQVSDGWTFRAQLINAYKPIIDFNNSAGSDADKYHFGFGPSIPDNLHGAVIDKNTLNYVVMHRYPAWSMPSIAARNSAAEQYVRSQTDPTLRAQYTDFYLKAKTAIAHLQKDEYPPEQAAKVLDLFRGVAVNFAQTDASFYKFYKTSGLATSFGPLEKQ